MIKKCDSCNIKGKRLYPVRITKDTAEFWCADCIDEEESWKVRKLDCEGIPLTGKGKSTTSCNTYNK